jgi:hypothetical protein
VDHLPNQKGSAAANTETGLQNVVQGKAHRCAMWEVQYCRIPEKQRPWHIAVLAMLFLGLCNSPATKDLRGGDTLPRQGRLGNVTLGASLP